MSFKEINVFNQPNASKKLLLTNLELSSIPSQILSSDFSKINQIDLSKNKINEIPIQFFRKLTSCQIINICDNILTSIPTELTKVKTLNELYLDNNQIPSLPPNFSDLKQLTILSLSNNKMLFLSHELFKMETITHLIVNNNLIQAIPSEISNLINLKILKIHSNKFISLPTTLFHLKNINEFSLEWFKYSNPPLPWSLNINQNEEDKKIVISLQDLLSTLYKNKINECSLKTFLVHFSTQGFDSNKKNEKGQNAYHVAAKEGDLSVIEGIQIEDINQIDNEGCTPLLISIIEEKFEISRKLIEFGANPEEGSNKIGSCLHSAVIKLDVWLVKELLKIKANANSIDFEGNTPLHVILGFFSRSHYRSAAISESLINAGAKKNITNNNGMTPLHVAICRNQIKAVKWILDQNSKENKCDENNNFEMNSLTLNSRMSSLHLACKSCNILMCKLLLKAGVNLFQRSKDLTTARMESKGNLCLFKLMTKAEQNSIFSSFKENQKNYFRNLKNFKNLNNLKFPCRRLIEENNYQSSDLYDKLNSDFNVLFPSFRFYNCKKSVNDKHSKNSIKLNRSLNLKHSPNFRDGTTAKQFPFNGKPYQKYRYLYNTFKSMDHCIPILEIVSNNSKNGIKVDLCYLISMKGKYSNFQGIYNNRLGENSLLNYEIISNLVNQPEEIYSENSNSNKSINSDESIELIKIPKENQPIKTVNYFR